VSDTLDICNIFLRSLNMNGAQWLVHSLKERGIEYIFALCGNGLDPFLKACSEFNIKVIDTRNEQSASYMADAWGRMTGKLGVVAVSSGPGHTNTITGVANAFWDGGPMMLISGCSSQDTIGLDNFQEIDQVGIVAPITKYAAMSRHIANFPHEVNKAISSAVTGRPGPVHLTIPADIFNAKVDESLRR
jgi:acetolactate synthase-1/2/3 large subunit